MKGKIITVYQYVRNAKTEQDVAREHIKGKLLELSKNGIEIGGKKRSSRR